MSGEKDFASLNKNISKTAVFKLDPNGDKEVTVQLCSDCEDHPALIFCENCGDAYCNECFISFHKKGSRKDHRTHLLKQELPANLVAPLSETALTQSSESLLNSNKTSTTESNSDHSTTQIFAETDDTYSSSLGLAHLDPWHDRAKFIPLRLNSKEQKELSLVECALSVSEYTDHVDIRTGYSGQRKIQKYLSELLSIVAGLGVASDYKMGETLVKGKSFGRYPTFFQHMFEVARRYKITNPEKMRDTYGKMIYALMDSQFDDIAGDLGLRIVVPIRTVWTFISEKDGSDPSVFARSSNKQQTEREDNSSLSTQANAPVLPLSSLLDDPLLNTATLEVFSSGRPAALVQQELRRKDEAIRTLCQRYSRTEEQAAFLNSQSTIVDSSNDNEQGDNTASNHKISKVQAVSPDDVRLVIYSLADNQSFLRFNSLPCQKMIDFLFYYFSPDQNQPSPAYKRHLQMQKERAEHEDDDNTHKHSQHDNLPPVSAPSALSLEKVANVNDDDSDVHENYVKEGSYFSNYSFGFYSHSSSYSPDDDTGKNGRYLPHTSNDWNSKGNLTIQTGHGGARLTHNHSTQFLYVKQSLQLWKSIVGNFFKLWYCAEQDLLQNGNLYHLRDTGQGMNRMQSCPRVGREMNRILGQMHGSLGREPWIGSSAVHLNDANVPNAFMFIDKYTQVSRILNPIVSVLERIPRLCSENESINNFICSQYGSVDLCRMEILQDFFRHGFDGSGADDYFSAGSCIDGRLTSAWNWCSRLEKKRFFIVFLLCGFIGFDGAF